MVIQQILCTLCVGGSDYVSGRYTIVIPAGQVIVPFDVAIINDTLLEKNENFDLIILAGLLPNRIDRVIPGKTTVTIIDDDGRSMMSFV